MPSSSPSTARNISRILAGLILISTLLNWQVALLFRGLVVDPWTTQNLMLAGIYVPGFVSCLIGSVLLLFGKRWGYYCIYASLLLALGPGISFIPYVVEGVQTLTRNPILLMSALFATNLGVTAVLIRTHRILLRTESA